MNPARRPPPNLRLEHPTDERTDFLLELEALRARGREDLAALLQRGYTASFTGRGAFGSRPKPNQRRQRP